MRGFGMTRFGKMMLRAGLAAMAVGIAGSAQAAEYIITNRGTVFNNFNTGRGAEFFGATSTNSLEGARFEAVFHFTFPGPGVSTSCGANCSQFETGGRFGFPNSAISANLTINGISRSIDGNLESYVTKLNVTSPSIFDFLQAVASERQGLITNTLTIQAAALENMFLTTNFDELFLYPRLGDPSGVGNFYFVNGITSQSTRGDLRSDYLRWELAPLSGAVPEPATWAMMIAGFGLVGGAMRRKRGQTVKVGYAA
jgi:hypothetical protein